MGDSMKLLRVVLVTIAILLSSHGHLGGIFVWASPSVQLTASGSNPILEFTPVLVDPLIEVSSSANIENPKVEIANGFSGDALSAPGCNYVSASQVLNCPGSFTAAQLQTLFRSVTFSTTSTNTTPREIIFYAANVLSFEGSYYEYVDTSVTWATAFTQASQRTLFGLTGYLATVTSDAENEFIRNRMRSDAWIGATDDYNYIKNSDGTLKYSCQYFASCDNFSEGKWHWVTGPEAGTFFHETIYQYSGKNLIGATGSKSVVSQTTLTYAKWDGGEPNEWGSIGEHYAYIITAANGTWNDFSATQQRAYIVEYRATGNDSFSVSKTLTFAPLVLYSNNLATSGSVPIDETRYSAGDTVTVLSNPGNLRRTNFFLAGWSLNSSGTPLVGSSLVFSNRTTLFPSWQSFLATSSLIGTPGFESATLRIQNALASNGHYVVLQSSAATPSADQIRNPDLITTTPVIAFGTHSLSANVGVNLNLTNLSPGTSYRLHFIAEKEGQVSNQTNLLFSTRAYGAPSVTSTTAISAITQSQAASGGVVFDDGSDGTAPILDRGVCWSTSPNPTVNNDCVREDGGTGSFSALLSGLTHATLYYVRAFATNALGSAYGPQISFTTLNRVITQRSISSIPVPVVGASPATTLDALQYSGTLTWSPNHATFQAGVSYSATLTLTPKAGFMLNGVGANFFQVAGAQSVTHSANSGVISLSYAPPVERQVHFITDGNIALEPLQVEVGAFIPEPSLPARVGHTFLGWYTDRNFTELFNFALTRMPANSLQLYAKWENRQVVSPTLNVQVNNLASAVDLSAEIANGDDVYVMLRLEILELLEVPSEDVDKVETFITRFTRRPDLFYFDISLLKVVNDETISLPQANDLITLEMEIPINLRNKENYRIFRVHNGEVDELEVVYDPNTFTLRFETDKFSTYTLGYNTPIPVVTGSQSTPGGEGLPNTDGLYNHSFWFVTMGLILIWGEKRLRTRQKDD
jgi:uncharacterized repeat protein (TIGR02543 family)